VPLPGTGWARVALLGGAAEGFPGGRSLLAAALIDAVGTGSVIPVSVLYFTIHVGLSPASVGVGLTVGGLVAMALAPLTGALIDGVGARRALLAFWGLAAAAFAGYGAVSSWAEFLVVATASLLASDASASARKTLVAELAEGAALSQVMASQRVIRNVGYGVGGLLATGALAVGNVGFLLVVYGNAETHAPRALAGSCSPSTRSASSSSRSGPPPACARWATSAGPTDGPPA
jgi:MFS family permease